MTTKEKLEILNSICTKKNGADTILENYGYSTQMPVNISGLLGTLGIFTKEWDFKKIEHSSEYADKVINRGTIVGAIACNEDKMCCYVDEYLDKQEQRWVLAYLFSYACLHLKAVDCKTSYIVHKTDILYNSTKHKDVWVLASELIMSERIVCYVHTNLIVPLFSVFCSMFDVPDYVVRVRMDNLHLKYEMHL